ncbi:hypothetical protein F4811DRAFT_567615 [Daldinia bambusicola]|nr:hypothetical protein F4811DRAFT_567615 [Daldinia bambusicola]
MDPWDRLPSSWSFKDHKEIFANDFFANYRIPTMPGEPRNNPIHRAFHSVPPGIRPPNFGTQPPATVAVTTVTTAPVYTPVAPLLVPRPSPNQLLGLTVCEGIWLRRRERERERGSRNRPSPLDPLARAARVDMACAGCRAALDQGNASDAEAEEYMETRAGTGTTVGGWLGSERVRYLCGFHFCWLAGARRDGDFAAVSGLGAVDREWGGVRARSPRRMVEAVWLAQLLVESGEGEMGVIGTGGEAADEDEGEDEDEDEGQGGCGCGYGCGGDGRPSLGDDDGRDDNNDDNHNEINNEEEVEEVEEEQQQEEDFEENNVEHNRLNNHEDNQQTQERSERRYREANGRGHVVDNVGGRESNAEHRAAFYRLMIEILHVEE